VFYFIFIFFIFTASHIHSFATRLLYLVKVLIIGVEILRYTALPRCFMHIFCINRAVATGPAGPVAARPIFG